MRQMLVGELLEMLFHVLQEVQVNNNNLKKTKTMTVINKLEVDFYKTYNVFPILSYFYSFKLD